jgi:hypothetical protein
MKVQWHCRGCNNLGEEEIEIQKILKVKKNENVDLFTIILSLIKHSCSNKDLGVRCIPS